MTPRELTVYMRDVFAGVLTDLGPGAMRFVYDPQYVTSGGLPLSLSLPVDGSASSTVVRNWFANLLPEGDARVAVSAEARVPVHDDFGLLKRTARALAEALPNAGKALAEEGANAAVIERSVPWLVDRAMAIADGAPVPPPPQRRAKAPRTSTGWTLS